MGAALGKMLGKLFTAPATRKPDIQRKAREAAKKLAAQHDIEIERLKGGGFNVWPPKKFAGEDPHEGDHFASDWEEVLEHVRPYVRA
jgi:hypothetical protein